MSSTNLPADSASQTFVSVKAIVGGHLFLPYLEVFQDSTHLPLSEGCRVPSFAFLIAHPTHGRALFDLGLKKHNKGYPPAMTYLEAFQTECNEDVANILQKGGIEPATIRRVFYSHLHWDHVGDLAKFPSAEVVLAADARVLLEDAYPKNPDSYFQELPPGRPVTYLESSPDVASQQKILSPFVTFENAIDFYDDGSLYLVEAPGHIPGHFGALARVAPNSFVFLAADTCHNRECYAPGTRLVSEENNEDVVLARETVRRLVKMNEKAHNAVIVLAHEREREAEMPLFPNELGPWVIAEIEKRKATEGK